MLLLLQHATAGFSTAHGRARSSSSLTTARAAVVTCTDDGLLDAFRAAVDTNMDMHGQTDHQIRAPDVSQVSAEVKELLQADAAAPEDDDQGNSRLSPGCVKVCADGSTLRLPLEPLEIIQEQISALQQGPDDESLARFWSFVDPAGALSAAHDTPAAGGSLVRFQQKMRCGGRASGRWSKIHMKPLVALLECHDAEIVKGPNRGFVDGQTFVARVKARPCFPDAPDAEASVLFEWVLRRQVTGSLAAPRAVWRVDDIQPDWQGWNVAH